MRTLTIELDDELAAHLDRRAAGPETSAADYVLALIEADCDRAAERELEAKLIEGLEGGEGELLDRDGIRAQGREMRRKIVEAAVAGGRYTREQAEQAVRDYEAAKTGKETHDHARQAPAA